MISHAWTSLKGMTADLKAPPFHRPLYVRTVFSTCFFIKFRNFCGRRRRGGGLGTAVSAATAVGATAVGGGPRRGGGGRKN